MAGQRRCYDGLAFPAERRAARFAVIGTIAASLGTASCGGAGAGASRLVTGSRPVHSALERALARWKGTDAAICFPTGFAANLGALSVLGGPGVLSLIHI